MINDINQVKPIEVDFRDVNETESLQVVDTSEAVKAEKLLFKMVVAVLQKKAKAILSNKAKIIELVTKSLSFCKRLGNISFLKKWVLDIPKLCDMLIDTVNGVYKAPYSSLVMVAIAIIYAVSPFDLLHDALPIIGVLDDVTILKAVLNTIKNDLESYEAFKQTQAVA